MKKLKLKDIKGEPYIFLAIEICINELLQELADKGIIELDEESDNSE